MNPTALVDVPDGAPPGVTNTLPAGIHVMHIDDLGRPTFRYVSPRWLEICGLTGEQLITDPDALPGIVHPQDRNGWLAEHQRAAVRGTPVEWEGRLLVDEQEVWVEMQSNPCRQPEGETLWHGVIMDVTERRAASARRESSAQRMQRILEDLPLSVVVATLTAERRVIFSNETFQRTFGYGPHEIRSIAHWCRLVHPEDEPLSDSIVWWDQTVAQAKSVRGKTASRLFRVQRKDGETREVEISATVIDNMLVAIFEDCTECNVTRRDLDSVRAALAQTAYDITEAIPVGTYTMVLSPGAPLARFSFMSTRFLQLTGLDRETAERDTMQGFNCVHPDDREHWVALNAEAFANKTPFFGQTRVVVQGEVRWITAESVPRELPDGTTVWEGVLIDVTDRVEAEQGLRAATRELAEANRELRRANAQLIRLASVDQLTGLRNRRAFEEAAELELERASRYHAPLALLLLDIDHFKQVNDRHGHLVGDQVLANLSRLIAAQIRVSDILARWGGEEYVLLLPHCGLEEGRAVAEKLRAAVAKEVWPAPLDGSVTVSIGMTTWRDSDTLDDLLARADEALYRAKVDGRNRVCVSGPPLSG